MLIKKCASDYNRGLTISEFRTFLEKYAVEFYDNIPTYTNHMKIDKLYETMALDNADKVM